MASLTRASTTDNRTESADKGRALRAEIDGSPGQARPCGRRRAGMRNVPAVSGRPSRFHKYSWHNTLLIAMQRPSATQVAGFQAWRKLGRHVMKGERGIMIFAPCPWRRESVTDAGDTETESGVYFKPVHVFDVAQTDGPELPTVDVPPYKPRR